mmetsp:Transcript_51931/g.135207  ORF Transcript_51931/g.135207 Transcript_51931/m.135207 type:complete len:258 (-) Transcript_51931:197-970(-)
MTTGTPRGRRLHAGWALIISAGPSHSPASQSLTTYTPPFEAHMTRSGLNSSSSPLICCRCGPNAKLGVSGFGGFVHQWILKPALSTSCVCAGRSRRPKPALMMKTRLDERGASGGGMRSMVAMRRCCASKSAKSTRSLPSAMASKAAPPPPRRSAKAATSASRSTAAANSAAETAPRPSASMRPQSSWAFSSTTAGGTTQGPCGIGVAMWLCTGALDGIWRITVPALNAATAAGERGDGETATGERGSGDVGLRLGE